MSSWMEGSPLAKTLIVCASLVIIVAGLKAAASIVVPFLLAIFIAIIVTPIYFWLQRMGLSSAVSLMVMISSLVILGFVGAKVTQESVSAFLRSQGEYQEKYAAQTQELWNWLVGLGIARPDQSFGDLVDPRAAIGYFGKLANTLRGLLTQATLILIVVIFILLEAAAMPDKLRALPGLSEDTWKRMTQIVEDSRRYISLKTVTSAMTGLIVWLFLSMLGVENAVFLGVLAFVLNYVPTIGSVIAGIPGVLIAFIQLGIAPAIITAVGYVAINFGVSNGVEPRIMGRGLGLSPLVIIVSMFFWGWVLGPIGMLLSVPLTMTAKIAMESADETQWVALLMASGSQIRAARRDQSAASGKSKPLPRRGRKRFEPWR